MSGFQLRFEYEGKLANLVLANTSKRNVITLAMWQALPDLLEQAKTARVLLIHGDGEHFSAGADIHEMSDWQGNSPAARQFRQTMQIALQSVRHFPAPTIANIRGTCFGAGLALAMACDLRFADTTAHFCVPPAKLGLLYPKEDVAQLVTLVGPAMAKQWLFTAEVVSPKRAEQTGLINQVQGFEQTQELAKSILANSKTSVYLLKNLVDGRLDDPDLAFEACFDGKDFQEGVSAFADKRRPDYS